MTLKKKILKNFITQKLLALLGVVYILVVKITSKIYFKNMSIPKKYWANTKPFILVFWHSQLLMINYSWKNKDKLNILASGHNDGQFGAIIANYLGANTITVSNKKRKINIRPIFELLKNNKCIAITPDGPQGPKEKISEGVIKIAKQAKVPIIPIGFWSSRNFNLNSWDSFLITLPFSKCNFVWGQDISIPENLEDKDINKYKIILEEEINRCIEVAKLNIK